MRYSTLATPDVFGIPDESTYASSSTGLSAMHNMYQSVSFSRSYHVVMLRIGAASIAGWIGS
jgi:hypothetical protein